MRLIVIVIATLSRLLLLASIVVIIVAICLLVIVILRLLGRLTTARRRCLRCGGSRFRFIDSFTHGTLAVMTLVRLFLFVLARARRNGSVVVIRVNRVLLLDGKDNDCGHQDHYKDAKDSKKEPLTAIMFV